MSWMEFKGGREVLLSREVTRERVKRRCLEVVAMGLSCGY